MPKVDLLPHTYNYTVEGIAKCPLPFLFLLYFVRLLQMQYYRTVVCNCAIPRHDSMVWQGTEGNTT